MSMSALAGLFANRVAAGTLDISKPQDVPTSIKADVETAVRELAAKSNETSSETAN
ncbi:hypothetical protein [Lacticaseibacillus sharpeae]|uniref:hypothetical protein n=1 Tax=Lacticaseibacillus sharpeae TaxID=1626 RepID=UPI000A9D0CA3|nr:hypothetical protein [Lacticaseibacillus sharpeae]